MNNKIKEIGKALRFICLFSLGVGGISMVFIGFPIFLGFLLGFVSQDMAVWISYLTFSIGFFAAGALSFSVIMAAPP